MLDFKFQEALQHLVSDFIEGGGLPRFAIDVMDEISDNLWEREWRSSVDMSNYPDGDDDDSEQSVEKIEDEQ